MNITIDLSTLAFANFVVALCCGTMLVGHWLSHRGDTPAFWLSLSEYSTGIGLLLLLWAVIPEWAAHVFGHAILNIGLVAGLFAAQKFRRPNASNATVYAGGVCVIAVILLGVYSPQAARSVSLGASVLVYLAAACEFWLGRRALLRSSRLMVGLNLLHAAAFTLLASPTVVSDQITSGERPDLFHIIHFEGLIYQIGSAILLVAMLKERSAMVHRAAALVDSLTGLANRRAFMERGHRLVERCENNREVVSLLVFDLDSFKSINDTFGHATGDQALRIFGDVLARVLRPYDLGARIGGEEFAAILPGCSIQAAFALAERIRTTFQGDAVFIGGQRVGATVSIGISSALPSAQLEDMLCRADAALYRAKRTGRNRVVSEGSSIKEAIVRIA